MTTAVHGKNTVLQLTPFGNFWGLGHKYFADLLMSWQLGNLENCALIPTEASSLNLSLVFITSYGGTISSFQYKIS